MSKFCDLNLNITGLSSSNINELIEFAIERRYNYSLNKALIKFNKFLI